MRRPLPPHGASRPPAVAAGFAIGWLLYGPALAEPAPARDERSTLSFTLDNDLFGGSDRYYTNGFLLSWRSASDVPPGWLDDLADAMRPLVSDGSSRRWGLAVGQSIFTPYDIDRTNPDPDDRPYAGWLYGAVTLSSYTETSYGNLELQLGVVGPSALGEQVQNGVHDLWNIDRAKGWDYQLKDEPGINLMFNRLWRYNWLLDASDERGLAVGVIPSFTASVGNVSTFASTGLLVRAGRNLRADFGPPRIRPAAAGTAFVEPDGRWGWYVFAGLDGRAVVRDVFLDGNTFKDSRSVDKKNLVGDASAGVALVFPWGRLSYAHTFRSEEFDGQDELAEFGSISLSVRF